MIIYEQANRLYIYQLTQDYFSQSAATNSFSFLYASSLLRPFPCIYYYYTTIYPSPSKRNQLL